MRSSTWRALGNTYVVVETDGGALDAERASTLAGGADGVLEVLDDGARPRRDRDLESRRITSRSSRGTERESLRHGSPPRRETAEIDVIVG